jgi:hypothetical protein
MPVRTRRLQAPSRGSVARGRADVLRRENRSFVHRRCSSSCLHAVVTNKADSGPPCTWEEPRYGPPQLLLLRVRRVAASQSTPVLESQLLVWHPQFARSFIPCAGEGLRTCIHDESLLLAADATPAFFPQRVGRHLRVPAVVAVPAVPL